MIGLLARRLAVGLAALLLAAPLAVVSSVSVLEDPPEGDPFGAGVAFVCDADPHARLLGVDDSFLHDFVDSTVPSLSLSRPPPGTVR
jgi:hypothetical protein